jgi:hypothetical protein
MRWRPGWKGFVGRIWNEETRCRYQAKEVEASRERRNAGRLIARRDRRPEAATSTQRGSKVNECFTGQVTRRPSGGQMEYRGRYSRKLFTSLILSSDRPSIIVRDLPQPRTFIAVHFSHKHVSKQTLRSTKQPWPSFQATPIGPPVRGTLGRHRRIVHARHHHSMTVTSNPEVCGRLQSQTPTAVLSHWLSASIFPIDLVEDRPGEETQCPYETTQHIAPL